jgi:hypothetical protein
MTRRRDRNHLLAYRHAFLHPSPKKFEMSSGKKQNRLEKDNLTVAAPVLARWLGVTGKTVYELTKAGIAVRAEHGDLYRLEESVRRYCEHLRRTASQGGEASQEAIRAGRLPTFPGGH